MKSTLLQDADAIWPLIERKVAALVNAATRGTGGAAAIGEHDIGGTYHKGVLRDEQAPQFLLIGGTRALTGHLAVDAGITIDGVDISVHAADPNAHHAQATAGSGISVTGQQIAINPSLAGNGLSYAAGVLAVGVSGLGLGVGADAVTLTSSSNPGAAASILATSAAGALTLSGTLQMLGANASAQLHLRASTPGYDSYLYQDGSSLRLDVESLDSALLVSGAGIVTVANRLATPLIVAASHLTLQPTNDLILSPGSNLAKLASGKTFQSDGYVSQLTGMRVTHDGQGDFRYIYVDELHAKAFIADLEQALAGGQIICKSVSMLGANFTVPAAGATATLTVRDLPSAENMAVFQSGDIVRLRVFSRAGGGLTIADCWGAVTSYADQANKLQTWTFTRSAAPNSGAVAAGTVIATDAIVLDYGTSGNGYHEVNAIDGLYGANSPYSQIVTWTGHPATGQTLRTRMGNLYGLFAVAGEYGLYAGNGTSNDSGYLRISSNSVRLNNIPLTLYSGGTQKVNISATGTDVWIGVSSADKRLSWDGGTLTVKGAIVVQAGSTGIGTFGDAGTLATVDNLDGVPEGTTYRRTTVNEKTGAGRAYSALDSSNRLITQIDPGTAWGANPGAGVAGLLLGSDYMGYWNGTAWKSYLDNAGRFYLNSGGTSNYLSWNGTTLAVHGAITVTGGNANITVGSGTKDSNLDGWNIGASEIVGQLNGADQVVMDANGQILAGGSTVRLSNAGVEILRGSGSAVNRLLFVSALGGETTARITCYTDSSAIAPYYNTNVLILEPLTSTGKAYRHTRVVGDLVVSGGIIAEDTSTVWHAGNDGASSGLNADLLDGYEGSAFGRLSAYNAWTNSQEFFKAGGRAWYAFIDTSGMNYGPIIQTSGALGTSTNYDYLMFHHVSNDVMGITVADSAAYRSLALQPSGGYVLIGTTSNTYSARLNVSGNIHCDGVITSEEYIQIEQRSGAPVAASGFGRIYVDSTDGDLKIIFGNGTVKTIATN